jgi:hypothetical protein
MRNSSATLRKWVISLKTAADRYKDNTVRLQKFRGLHTFSPSCHTGLRSLVRAAMFLVKDRAPLNAVLDSRVCQEMPPEATTAKAHLVAGDVVHLCAVVFWDRALRPTSADTRRGKKPIDCLILAKALGAGRSPLQSG